jgi:DNA-binding response OmpR family regulator
MNAQPQFLRHQVPQFVEGCGMLLDRYARTVDLPLRYDNGQRLEPCTLELTSVEFKLLDVLMTAGVGVAVSREFLLLSVWKIHWPSTTNVVDVYIRYLRVKIGVHRIETVRGAGYKLAVPRGILS